MNRKKISHPLLAKFNKQFNTAKQQDKTETGPNPPTAVHVVFHDKTVWAFLYATNKIQMLL